jgi:hypothetical protein
MPHQNTRSSAATDRAGPNDQAREQQRSLRPEPRSYAAPDVADASLAPPAAGEIADYMDEGEALGDPGLQQGRNKTNRPGRTEMARGQGRKTRAANRQTIRSRLSDRGDAKD